MKGFHNIKIEPAYGLKTISDIRIECTLNEHATLHLYGILDEAVNINTTINASFDDEIHICEKGSSGKTIFKGLVSRVKTKNVNGVYYMELQAISGSYRMDIKKKCRSFQDIEMEYSDVIKEVLKDYPKNDFIKTIGEGVKIGEPILQYKETDWELIKRLASRFNSVITPDISDTATRLCFGFPKGKSYEVEDNLRYSVKKNMEAFMRAKGSDARVNVNDFIYYEIERGKQYNIGDEITFKDKKMYIESVEAYIYRGLLTFKYRLSRKEGIYVTEFFNSEIKGVSLGGKVLDTKDELVKLHLDIDKSQLVDKAYWFPFIPPTGDIMYCMPQKGTHASLYFPDSTGNNAKVTGCVRKNGGTCQKTGNPSTRFLGIEHGSELEMSPIAINIVGDSKEPIKLSIDDEKGISIVSHKKLFMVSKEELSITTPKHVTLAAHDLIFLKKSSSDSGFTIENEFHFLAGNVVLDGRIRESYPPFADAPAVVPKPPFNWGKLALNVLGGLAIVAAVAAAAVFTVATFGAGAVVIGAVATCAVIGGTAAVASQAVSDIANGEVSDFSTYAGAAARETVVGAISGAVFGPLGPATTLGGKMAIGAGTNAFESVVRQTLEGKGINPWTVLLDAGIGAGTAGIVDSKIAKKVAGAIDNAAPWIKKGAGKVINGIDDSANKFANASRKLTGQAGEEAGEKAFQKSIMNSNETHCINDPINVVNGSFYLDVTDLVIEDRGMNLEIKRSYNSVGIRNGVMGEGWIFEYESKLNREDFENLTLIYPDGHDEKFILVDKHWQKKDSADRSETLCEDLITGYYILTRKDGKSYTYDGKGKLIAVSDRNQNTISVKYRQDGLIDKITSPGGRVLSFRHECGKITEIADDTGRKVVYRHGGDKLVGIILPNKGEFIYKYEGTFITSITDANGRCYVSNDYNEAGRVIRQCVNEQDTVDMQYDLENNETTFIYRATGNMEKYRYNDNGLLTETIHSDGTKELITYDEYRNRASETDWKGETTFRVYDDRKNLLEERFPGGFTVWNEYDSMGSLTRTSTSGGSEVMYTYDERGNLIEESLKIDDGEYSRTAYSYDRYGRMLSRTDAEDNKTEFEYKDDGVEKPTTVKDPEGNVFGYRYDGAGRLEAITTSYGTVEFGYNEINKKVFIKDAQGGITYMSYDKMGNLIRKVLPNGVGKGFGSGLGNSSGIGLNKDLNKGSGTGFSKDSNIGFGIGLNKDLKKDSNGINRQGFGKDTGNSYDYVYDAMDRLIQTTDPLNNVFALKYDLNGNLIKEVNANYYDSIKEDGIGIEYIYDKNNRRIKTVLSTGEIARTKYDAAGNIIKTIDPGKYVPEDDDGPGMEYSYDSMNRLTAIKDAEGNVAREYEYNPDGLVIRETDADKLDTLYNYNAAGWLLEKRTAVEENDGKKLYCVIQYTYDMAGRRTAEKRSTQKVSEQEKPAEWNTISYQYDKNSRIIKITDSTGAEAEYVYDCLGNRTYEKVRINDKTAKVNRYHYNSLGRLDKRIEEIDGKDLAVNTRGKALAQTVYEYDRNGNVVKITSPLGYETEMFYDAADRLVQTIRREKGAASRTAYYEYDRQGNLIKETDTNGKCVLYAYDSINRRIRITGKEGEVTRLFYDGAGNIIKHVKPEDYDTQKDDGSGTVYSYDSMNRLVEVRNPLGQIVAKNKYNATGDLVEKTDALNESIEYTYYSAGRIKEILTPGARVKGKTSQEYTYDALGNITGIKDGEGNRTTHTLDLWGRVTEIQKPDGSSEKYTYDCAGNVTASIDGNGRKTQYEYNSMNLLARVIDPAGEEIRYKYDLQGRLAKKIDRNCNTIEYMYNKDGKLTLRKDAETGRSEEFGYYADGSLMTASGMGTVYNYSYTPDMKLKSKSMNGKLMLEYNYDKNGNIVELKDLTGRKTNYKYDALGRMEEVWDSGKLAAAYTYRPDNQVAGIRYGNGITVEYSHDPDKNVAGIAAKSIDGIEILKHNYEYDNNGNQIKKEENGSVTEYIYDGLNRLSKVVCPDAEELFSYDNAGNRIVRRKGGIETGYSYDIRNRLIERIEGSEQTKYSYDSNGNLLTETGRQETVSYTYDHFNRTERVRKSNGDYIRNFYDPEGLRNRIEENGRTARFIYSGRDIVAEFDGGKVKAASIRGHELLMQRDAGGEGYYYLNDAHGDVIGLADGKGQMVNSYRYDAFGNIVESREKVHNRFKYAGEQFDAVTGQYYLRARFYNPVVGRFMQEDTYRGDGLNLYAYVGNNPVNYYDPSGYSSCGKKTNPYDPDKGKAPKADFYVAPDGKTTMMPPDVYEKIRAKSIVNPKSNVMTLGKYEPTITPDGKIDWSTPGKGAYTQRAGDTTYFSLGNEWDDIKKTYNMTDNDMFGHFNVPALDDAANAGKTFRFSHDPRSYSNCALVNEWEHLKVNYGYTDLENIDGFWYATK